MTKLTRIMIILTITILAVTLGARYVHIMKKTVLTNQEALDIGKTKYQQAISCYWGNLEYSTELIENIGEADTAYYEVTNINEIKQIFTTNAFADFCDEYGLKEKNGVYYKVAADRGSDITYVGNELKVDSISENKIVYTSIETYNDNEEITTKEYQFILIKENGNWKVDEFTLPN